MGRASHRVGSLQELRMKIQSIKMQQRIISQQSGLLPIGNMKMRTIITFKHNKNNLPNHARQLQRALTPYSQGLVVIIMSYSTAKNFMSLMERAELLLANKMVLICTGATHIKFLQAKRRILIVIEIELVVAW